MTFRHWLYLSGYSIPAVAFVSITWPQWAAFATVVFAFVIIPLFEFLLPLNRENVPEAQEFEWNANRWYDYILYLSVPVQYGCLGWFLYQVHAHDFTALQLTGMTLSAGIVCGVIGINIAHELGHRNKTSEQYMALALLLSAQYMHFYVEHNRGHHRYVATPLDPATARKGESLYRFQIRSMVMGYFSAWKIQAEILRKEGKSWLSLSNRMLLYQIMQLTLIVAVFATWGLLSGLLYLAAACVGILLLETINYIEHYGLSRKQRPDGSYEKVLHSHSWNANQILGRLLLFELTRHADHHYKASRKYQILRHDDRSPQLPAGYPAMMLLSTIPPLWYYIMDRRIQPDGTGSDHRIAA
jgi:alkane 1-monooxygenase